MVMTTSSPNAISLILSAAAFAAHKHRDQRRKDAAASPYINHPLALAQLLADECGITDPAVIAAALLHDTVEDTDTTLEELAETFGDEIAGLVAELTDDKSLPKATRKQLQIDHAAHASDKAKLVKLADKICNLRDLLSSPPADWPAERIQAYFIWAGNVVSGLRGTHSGLEALFDSLLTQKPTEH